MQSRNNICVRAGAVSVALGTFVALLFGAGAALAGSSLLQTVAPRLPGVVGVVNPDCSSQLASQRYTSSKAADGHCILEFGHGEFPRLPIGIITPIGGTVAGVSEGVDNSNNNWEIQVSFASPTLFNFVATPHN
jgi:hypothetical protein